MTRAPEVIRAQYRAVIGYQPAADTEEFRNFLAGALAALEWVLGGAETPATGRCQAVTVERMEREERYCDGVIYSSEARPPLDRDYANGVEHALSWARGVEDEPPTPLAGTVPATGRLCTCR